MQRDKLKNLPVSPGVYFHKDKTGEIIYIGKAAVLKNRVKQYFQNQRDMDIKTKALVAEIDDTDWVETESEIDALFLEAEMVKRYMPKFNILLRDDKSLTFIRIDIKSKYPFVSFTRNPIDDDAEYFGPYYNSFAIKKALRYLRKVFPYYTKLPKEDSRPDLDSHLGLNPVNMTSAEYKASLRKLISYIKGNRNAIITSLNNDMKVAAKLHDFETAAKIRNKIRDLNELQRRIMFGDKEFLDISKDEALRDLTELLGLGKLPIRIEGYDISHMSGTNVVASMVVFKNGVSDRSEYRKFKMRIEQNNDFYNMNETIARRLGQNNLKSWGKPNLVLIDGGKGQLDAALQARDKCEQMNVPFIGLAKRDEQIIIANNYHDILVNNKKLIELGGNMSASGKFTTIDLPNSTHIIKLLQRIRDESHRFAVSYHTILKRTRQTSNLLEEIPGIGPKTRSRLIRKFGSLRNLKTAPEEEIVAIIGPVKAKLVINYIQEL
ncbi:MAG: excinuclease subunit [Patescibacteria group bacterium]|nr:excinuclease subunit [Patescibacteria group bacterium]